MDLHKNHSCCCMHVVCIQHAYNTEWYVPKYKKYVKLFDIHYLGKVELSATLWNRNDANYAWTGTLHARSLHIGYRNLSNLWLCSRFLQRMMSRSLISKHTNSRWERIECVMAHYPQRAPIDQMLRKFIYTNERDSDKGYKGLWLLIMMQLRYIYFLKASL